MFAEAVELLLDERRVRTPRAFLDVGHPRPFAVRDVALVGLLRGLAGETLASTGRRLRTGRDGARRGHDAHRDALERDVGYRGIVVELARRLLRGGDVGTRTLSGVAATDEALIRADDRSAASRGSERGAREHVGAPVSRDLRHLPGTLNPGTAAGAAPESGRAGTLRVMATNGQFPADEILANVASLRLLARALVRDDADADDAAQDAAVALLSRRGSVPREPRAWLAGVVRNSVRRFFRSRRRRIDHERAAARSDVAGSTVDTLVRLEAQRRVVSALRGLEEPYRTAVVERFLDDLPPREIAARHGVPVETAKSWIRRGLGRLRVELGATSSERRRALAVVLVPFSSPLPSRAARWAVHGGAMSAKKSLVVAAIAVICLGVGFGVATRTRRGPVSETPWVEPRIVAETGPATLAAMPGKPLASVPGSAAGPRESPSIAETPPNARTPAITEDVSPAWAVDVGDGTIPAAVRRRSRGLASEDGNESAGGSGGLGLSGPVDTGHWERYFSGPPRWGGATIVVRVVDSEGEPIPHAEVLLGPPDDAGSRWVSRGDYRSLGETNAAGELTDDRVPEGRASVAADYRFLASGEHGLDGRPARRVVLRSGARASVTIRLPFARSSLGAIEGRVTDADGRGLAGVNIDVNDGIREGRSGASGSFRIDDLLVGSASLRATLWGYRGATATTTVTSKSAARVDLRLEAAETGPATVEGAVHDSEGRPVADAQVYLIPTNEDAGLQRGTKSDTAGQFAFRGMPARISETVFQITAWRLPEFGPAERDLPVGYAGQPIELRFAPRRVPLRVRVLDTATDDPIGPATCEARRPGEEIDAYGVFSWSVADRAYAGYVTPGRVEIRVDVLDCESDRSVIDVPAKPEGHTVTVRPKRTAPRSEEVELTVIARSHSTGAPIGSAVVEVLDRPGGEPFSRLAAERSGGVYRLPAASGRRALRVSAEGFETYDAPLELRAETSPASVEVRLRSR